MEGSPLSTRNQAKRKEKKGKEKSDMSFLGYLLVIGPIALLAWMFIKSEIDQAPIMDENGKLCKVP